MECVEHSKASYEVYYLLTADYARIVHNVIAGGYNTRYGN